MPDPSPVGTPVSIFSPTTAEESPREHGATLVPWIAVSTPDLKHLDRTIAPKETRRLEALNYPYKRLGRFKGNKPKISCAMIAWNEERAIDLSLKSLVGLVDEVIIAVNKDGDLDGTIGRAKECMDQFDLSGEVIRSSGTTLGEVRFDSFERCANQNVLLIDANLVLSKPLNNSLLWIASVGGIAKVKSLNLMGDYQHFFKPLPFHAHHFTLFTKNAVHWDQKLDRPKMMYGMATLVYSFAVNLSRVRPAWRHWLRGEAFDPRYSNLKSHKTKSNRQWHWLNQRRYGSILDYVKAEKGMTLDDVKRVAPGWLLDMLNRYAEPISRKTMSALPEVIKEELNNPRYKLLKDGKRIVGRYPEL